MKKLIIFLFLLIFITSCLSSGSSGGGGEVVIELPKYNFTFNVYNFTGYTLYLTVSKDNITVFSTILNNSAQTYPSTYTYAIQESSSEYKVSWEVRSNNETGTPSNYHMYFSLLNGQFEDIDEYGNGQYLYSDFSGITFRFYPTSQTPSISKN